MDKEEKNNERCGKSVVLTGEIVRSMREARGLSVVELADLIGASDCYVSMIEHGERKIFQHRAHAKLLRHVLFGESIESQRKILTRRKRGRPRTKPAECEE